MKHNRWHILFLGFLLATISVSVKAYIFREITMSNGLSDLLVNAIYKDSRGFIWLGTDNCLDRYDGVTIRHYPFREDNLKKKLVNVITEDHNTSLWIGNNAGLWRLAAEAEMPERIFAEMIDCPVYSIYVDESVIYIGTEKGLFIYKKDQLNQKLFNDHLFSPANKIHGIEKDESGNLWLATAEGLCKYEIISAKGSFYYTSTVPDRGSNFQHITRIDNTIYLGTPGQGILSFDITTNAFDQFVDVGNKIISALSSDGDNQIYVGTDGNGVHFLSHKEKKIITSFTHNVREKTSLRSNSVYSLLVDNEGIIWIGFYQAGVDYSLYQNGLFQTYKMPPDFETMGLTVRSFALDGEVKLIGTRDGLYHINEKTKKTVFFQQPQLRSNLILSIMAYEDSYYIGTYGGGLSVLDAKTLQLSNFKGSDDAVFQEGHIFCLRKDSGNVLWIGTSAGVYAYDTQKNQIRHFDHTNSQMPEGNTYTIFFDSTRKGWICTDNGLSIYDPSTNSMRSNLFPDNFFNKEKIRLVFEDKDKKLYFLPDRGGLLTSDLPMSTFDRYPIHNLLHGNAYTTILQDDEGWLWLGSDDGLIRMKLDREDYYSFNFTDGIPGNIFMNPACKDENGLLWFSNSNGLVFTDPRQVDSLKQNPYPVAVTDILIRGNSLSSEEKKKSVKSGLLKLNDRDNNVGFRFTNLLYSDPASALYLYKLEGVDKDWVLLSGENEVNYYDLKPGNYSFHVRTPGNESSEATVHLKIGSWFSLGRYWLTASLVALVIGILLYQLYQSRKTIYRHIRRKKKEEEINEAKEEKEEKYKTNRLSEAECQEIYDKLQQYMLTDKPYINQELKIVDLAKAIGVSSYSLSYLFNQYLNLSYYDYINQYRIEEFKRIVVDPKYKKYTLSTLANTCGFNSRSSFIRAFKKLTGITPSEYVQNIEVEE